MTAGTMPVLPLTGEWAYTAAGSLDADLARRAFRLSTCWTMASRQRRNRVLRTMI